MPSPDPEKENTFEEALQRLEAILEQMSQGDIALDTSLNLFEEANRLISKCAEQLMAAERRVETLIKDREGQLAVDANDQPLTKPFDTAR